MITLALSKGRIFDETLPLLASAGIQVLEDPEKSRKLILPTNHEGVRVVLVLLQLLLHTQHTDQMDQIQDFL